MNKFTDFPEQPRIMREQEGEMYFALMMNQIAAFNPDEIIAVNRSGFSYGMWAAQLLKKPLGAYWPKKQLLVKELESQRIVFVDDNMLGGSTYQATKAFMLEHYPTVEWRWAVLFTDWHTPKEVRDEIFEGAHLRYFAEEPMWGSKKVSKDYGVRYRDE